MYFIKLNVIKILIFRVHLTERNNYTKTVFFESNILKNKRRYKKLLFKLQLQVLRFNFNMISGELKL